MPLFRRFRKRRNNSGNVDQSRNQKPDSNEELFDFESQAAKFVSKLGMELGEETVVEVVLNMEGSPGGERQIMQDANENREETRNGIRVNRVVFGTYFHGFGLRNNDVIFLLNGHPIISKTSVNMNLLRIKSSFNRKLYMKLYRPDAMPSVVNAENAELSAVVESSVPNAEPEPSTVNENLSVVALDNQGNEPRDKDPEKLEYVEYVTCKIKSVHYEGYLTVNERSGSIVLSNGNTNATNNSVEFTMSQYQLIDWSQPGNPEFVTLQHVGSRAREYILADDGGLSLPNSRNHPTPPPSPPPSPPPTPRLIKNTNVYLFKVIKPDCTSSDCKCSANTVTFQPINKIGTAAIGFEKQTSIASLMSPEKCETHFELFNNSNAI